MKRQTEGFLTQVETVLLKCLLTSSKGHGLLYDSESTSLCQGSLLCSADKITHLILGETSCCSHLQFGYLQSHSLLSHKSLKNALLFISKIMLINFLHIRFTRMRSDTVQLVNFVPIRLLFIMTLFVCKHCYLSAVIDRVCVSTSIIIAVKTRFYCSIKKH